MGTGPSENEVGPLAVHHDPGLDVSVLPRVVEIAAAMMPGLDGAVLAGGSPPDVGGHSLPGKICGGGPE